MTLNTVMPSMGALKCKDKQSCHNEEMYFWDRKSAAVI